MEDTLTRAKIAEIMNRDVGLSKDDSLAFIEDLLTEISGILKEERELKIPFFGTFKVRRKRQRIGRNPKKANEEVVISARNVVSFSPSSTIKNDLNAAEDHE